MNKATKLVFALEHIAHASYQNATDNLDLISLFILEELT